MKEMKRSKGNSEHSASSPNIPQKKSPSKKFVSIWTLNDSDLATFKRSSYIKCLLYATIYIIFLVSEDENFPWSGYVEFCFVKVYIESLNLRFSYRFFFSFIPTKTFQFVIFRFHHKWRFSLSNTWSLLQCLESNQHTEPTVIMIILWHKKEFGNIKIWLNSL